MLTPPRLLTLVHAVQQPLGRPEFTALNVTHVGWLNALGTLQTAPILVESRTSRRVLVPIPHRARLRPLPRPRRRLTQHRLRNRARPPRCHIRIPRRWDFGLQLRERATTDNRGQTAAPRPSMTAFMSWPKIQARELSKSTLHGIRRRCDGLTVALARSDTNTAEIPTVPSSGSKRWITSASI